MLSLYILIISIVVCLAIGVLVLSRNSWDKLTVTYLLLTLTLIAMSVSNYLAIETELDQLLFVRLVMATSTVAIFLIYLLVSNMAPIGKNRTSAQLALLAATAIVAVLDMSSYVFSGVQGGSPPTPIVAPLAFVYFLHFFITFGATIYLLMKIRRRTHDTRQKGQYRLLLLGIVPILVFAPLTSFILPNLFDINNLVMLTPLYALVFTGSVGYAIIRHGLFDIKLAAVRSVAYIFSLGALALVYYFIAYVASALFFRGQTSATVSFSPINIALALILAFLFQPIKQFFDKVTNQIFYRDRYDTDEFIARLGDVLTSTTDLRELLKRASFELESTLKASFVSFLVEHIESNDEYPLVVSHSSHHIEEEVYASARTLLDGVEGSVIAIDNFKDNREKPGQYSKHVNVLAQSRISLVLDLGDAGLALFGEQKGTGFTHRDVRTLETVSDELIIAIQNARSVQEVQDINTHLEQRIDKATAELRRSNNKLKKLDATKDEFLSMASHQLRTPLTSIKGYISMVLDGDAGTITPQQEKLLKEAFVSSERMVRLIGDFLNVSRLQTGKFIIERRTVDLSELVRDEVESIQSMAATRDIQLTYKGPKHFPVLQLDEDKIRQVAMNFIDNAIYYSRPNSTIVVKLAKDEKYATLEVHDHGIGVPKESLDKLFTKFFRAENARRQRPDGTGVGLYLAKRVITEHGGELIVESTEGKGSVFGFRLPLKDKHK